MAANAAWTISVVDSQRANFKQPQGLPKPGADWFVALTGVGQAARITVRAYTEDVVGYSEQQEAQAVARYVAKLLQSGWSPAAYNQTAAELVLPKQPPPPAQTTAKPAEGSSQAKRPWWKFW
jgi:hypothetical protein